MKRYDAILLDLDNTLYPYQPTHQAAMDALYASLQEQCGIEKSISEQAFNSARQLINTQLHGTASSHNRLLYIQNLCERLSLNPAKYSLFFYNVYWDTFLNNLALFPHAKEFLDTWLTLGKRICLLTDLTAHIQHRKIVKLGLENYFEKIVTSEEVGRDKPHPSMFTTALNKLGLEKNQVIMLGDSMEKDILGARNIGIAAYCVNHDNESTASEKTVSFNSLIGMLS